VRIELTAQVANGVDPFAVVARLTPLIARIPHVASDPAPEIGVREFNAAGTVIYVRPYVRGGVPEQEAVHGAGYRAIAEATAGLPVPAPYQVNLQPRN
jgi:small conductance mechanosensitive channel